MSTSAAPESANPPSPATSSTTPSSAAPGSASGAPEFRYGEDADPWARGKTASEVLAITRELANVVDQYAKGPAPQPAPTTASQYRAPASDDFVTGESLQQATSNLQTQVGGQLAQIERMVAETNLQSVKQKYRKEFEKYGPKINGYLANVPMGQRTVDNLDRLVRFALTETDHVEELARERAAQLVAEMGPTMGRSSGGAGGAPISSLESDYSLSSEKLPEAWRERAKKAGLNERALDEFCRANDMSREDWFKLFERTAISEELTRRG